MKIFKEFYKSRPQLGINGVERRDRKPILGGTDYQKDHLNMVPAKYKTDNSKCQKIEILKTRAGRFFCDPKDLEYITANFLKGIPPKVGELKTLGGKLGIKLYHDAKSNKWVIDKQ